MIERRSDDKLSHIPPVDVNNVNGIINTDSAVPRSVVRNIRKDQNADRHGPKLLPTLEELEKEERKTHDYCHHSMSRFDSFVDDWSVLSKNIIPRDLVYRDSINRRGDASKNVIEYLTLQVSRACNAAHKN